MGLFLRGSEWKSGTCCQSLGWQGAAYTGQLQGTCREHRAQCRDIWGLSDTLPIPLDLLHALTPFAPRNKTSHICTAGTWTSAACWRRQPSFARAVLHTDAPSASRNQHNLLHCRFAPSAAIVKVHLWALLAVVMWQIKSLQLLTPDEHKTPARTCQCKRSTAKRSQNGKNRLSHLVYLPASKEFRSDFRSASTSLTIFLFLNEPDIEGDIGWFFFSNRDQYISLRINILL